MVNIISLSTDQYDTLRKYKCLKLSYKNKQKLIFLLDRSDNRVSTYNYFKSNFPSLSDYLVDEFITTLIKTPDDSTKQVILTTNLSDAEHICICANDLIDSESFKRWQYINQNKISIGQISNQLFNQFNYIKEEILTISHVLADGNIRILNDVLFFRLPVSSSSINKKIISLGDLGGDILYKRNSENIDKSIQINTKNMELALKRLLEEIDARVNGRINNDKFIQYFDSNFGKIKEKAPSSTGFSGLV